MDIDEKENIEKLLKSLRTDNNASKKLLQLFASAMYDEAKLYISDKEELRNTCMHAFVHAYSDLSRAEAENVESVLKKAVQDECIRTTLIEESNTLYIPDDEMSAENTFIPEDIGKIKSVLRNVLDYLTPSQRLIAVMKYRDGFSFSAIADKMNISESTVKSILQDAKNKLNKNNIDTGIILAMINKIYPYYEAPESEASFTILEKDLSTIKTRELTEEEQFNTTLNELKTFFSTTAAPTQSESVYEDSSGGDEEYSDSDQNTMELDTIVDNDSDEENLKPESVRKTSSILKTVNDPIVYWGKRIAIILALLAVGFGISFAVSSLRSKKAEPVATPEPVEMETATSEENTDTEENTTTEETESTQIPEETPEPDDGIIGSGYINVYDLTIRSGPGVNYEQTGLTEYGATYDVYEIAQADGYKWYRIGEGQWVADYEGQYVTYTAKE